MFSTLVKSHSFLKFFGWDSLSNLSINPPLKPDIKIDNKFTSQLLITHLDNIQNSDLVETNLQENDEEFNEWFSNF